MGLMKVSFVVRVSIIEGCSVCVYECVRANKKKKTDILVPLSVFS